MRNIAVTKLSVINKSFNIFDTMFKHAIIQVGKMDSKPVTRKKHPWQRVLFFILNKKPLEWQFLGLLAHCTTFLFCRAVHR